MTDSDYNDTRFLLNHGLYRVPHAESAFTVYPAGLQPDRWYTRNEVVDLLRKHKDDPAVVRFIADMMEV